MRIYFLSYKPAILKLNGLYLGGVDLFERHIEVSLSDSVLAEIVPGENLQSVNFFINEKLLSAPPPFLDVYLMDGEALIFVREFGGKDAGLDIILQHRFCGQLVTLFSQGGVRLTVDGAEYNSERLPQKFSSAHAEEKTIGGLPVLAIYGGNGLVILSDRGKIIFLNDVLSAEFGDVLRVEVAFETCTAAKAVCEYSYDGERLTLVSSKTVEEKRTEAGILHFAFFESVLCRGDYPQYLSEELKGKAGEIFDYLGEFVSVTVPTERFFCLHEGVRAAGLVYPKAKNLFEVKYFAVELDGDNKIDNIYPV